MFLKGRCEVKIIPHAEDMAEVSSNAIIEGSRTYVV